MDSPPPPPPPQRYKLVWRVLLISNLALGAYIFARARKKDTSVEDSKAAAKTPSVPIATATTPVPEEPALPPPITTTVTIQEPIPEDQQRELFKWILEEKRKIKPRDAEEKKRIDEEKAILKQFIRTKSIPSL